MIRPLAAVAGEGKDVVHVYDDLDHVTQVSAGGQSMAVKYDDAGNLTRRDSAGTGTGTDTTTFVYDGDQRTISRTSSTGGGLLGYGYDANGNLTAVSDAHGSTTYTYDSRNRLTSMTDPAGIYTSFAYAADSPFTYTDPNGQNWLGDLIIGGVAVVGVGLAIGALVGTSPVWGGLGLAVAVVGLGLAIDVGACNLGMGLACNVY